jgi:hypothetical protein
VLPPSDEQAAERVAVLIGATPAMPEADEQ